MPSFNHELLRAVRLDLGLTQEAAAAALGVDVRTYRRYESGAVNADGEFVVRSPARRALLRRLCEQFGVDDEAAWLVAAPAQAAPPASTAPSAPAPSPPAVASPVSPPRWRPRLAHALLRARHFVGRTETLEALARWYHGADDEPRVVALVAVGGAGKTALVERFVAEGVAPARGGVFVWCFYDDPRVEALLGQLLEYFTAEAAGSEGGRLERLLAALRGPERHLVVLDGLEVAQSSGRGSRAFGELEDPQLRRLVRAFAAGLGGARLLVTSRYRLADLDAWEGSALRTHALGALPARDGREVLRAWGLRSDEAALAALVERVGGHALSVAMLGSYVGGFLRGDAAALGAVEPREVAGDDALARRLDGVLARYAEALGGPERAALARLAVFPDGADVATLVALGEGDGAVAGELAGCDGAALARVLARLERLGLVFRGAGEASRFTAHPFVRDYFRARLDVPAAAVHRAMLDRLEAAAAARPAGVARETEWLDLDEARLAHALGAGEVHVAWEHYARSLGGFDHLGLRLGAMSRGARVARRFATDGSPEHLHAALAPGPRAALLYDWGLYAGALGDLALARRCYAEYLRVVESGPATRDAARFRTTGLRTLAYTHWLAGELDAAASRVAEAVAIARAWELRSHAARVGVFFATSAKP